MPPPSTATSSGEGRNIYDHTKKNDLLPRPCPACGGPAACGYPTCYGCGHAPATDGPPGPGWEPAPRKVEWTILGIGSAVILATLAAMAMVVYATFVNGK